MENENGIDDKNDGILFFCFGFWWLIVTPRSLLHFGNERMNN